MEKVKKALTRKSWGFEDTMMRNQQLSVRIENCYRQKDYLEAQLKMYRAQPLNAYPVRGFRASQRIGEIIQQLKTGPMNQKIEGIIMQLKDCQTMLPRNEQDNLP